MMPSPSSPRAAAPSPADDQNRLDDLIFGGIEKLDCLRAMAHYYQTVYRTIRHLVGSSGHPGTPPLPGTTEDVIRLSEEEVRLLRRFINSDLEHLGMEFYLQRVEWALRCSRERGTPEHEADARRTPATHPCRMQGRFGRIAQTGKALDYPYEDFLGETQAIFGAIHAHLVSINRAFGDLYYHVANLPFASFTPAGKNEIGHLSSELNRLMRGLMVATHLQPQREWQTDLVSYLLTCRADCQRFFETIPHYYQMHRLRLILYPIDGRESDEGRQGPHDFPVPCLPWSAGVYLDFLQAYQNIAHHTLAVIHWSIRLYARWNFVPRRVLQAIAPVAP
ncbi:MAG TPA: hypothetical protein VFR37_19495 [Longimicrobium sp.]|nr:hypothetical protein [Longimicrobium sp.]